MGAFMTNLAMFLIWPVLITVIVILRSDRKKTQRRRREDQERRFAAALRSAPPGSLEGYSLGPQYYSPLTARRYWTASAMQNDETPLRAAGWAQVQGK